MARQRSIDRLSAMVERGEIDLGRTVPLERQEELGERLGISGATVASYLSILRAEHGINGNALRRVESEVGEHCCASGDLGDDQELRHLAESVRGLLREVLEVGFRAIEPPAVREAVRRLAEAALSD